MSAPQGVEPFFHVGYLVPDLERAMAEMTATIGIMWGPVKDRASGEMRWRVVYSAGEPPYVELIEGRPGCPWYSPGGAELHHFGRYEVDLDRGIERIADAGGWVEVDGRAISGRWVYMRVPSSGALIELIEAPDGGVERLAQLRGA